MQRRLHPGTRARNLGIWALGVAAAGYAVGFTVAWLAHPSVSGAAPGGYYFFPLGGFASLFLAVTAIYAGTRIRRFLDSLQPIQRERLSALTDVELERSRATWGIILGAVSLAANPLLGFIVVMIARG